MRFRTVLAVIDLCVAAALAYLSASAGDMFWIGACCSGILVVFAGVLLFAK